MLKSGDLTRKLVVVSWCALFMEVLSKEKTYYLEWIQEGMTLFIDVYVEAGTVCSDLPA